MLRTRCSRVGEGHLNQVAPHPGVPVRHVHLDALNVSPHPGDGVGSGTRRSIASHAIPTGSPWGGSQEGEVRFTVTFEPRSQLVDEPRRPLFPRETQWKQTRRDAELEVAAMPGRPEAQAQISRIRAYARPRQPPAARADVNHLQRHRVEMSAELIELSAQPVAVVQRLSSPTDRADTIR